jgi:RHS repeat-associated protein
VHGWLKSLGTTAFQERLYYADAPYGATLCYNGNISVQQWKQSNEGFNRGYKFTYDALNRLTEAVYGENDFSDNLNDYNEKVVEYSLNGMMKRFQRRGKKSDGEYGKVDNLHIHLDGNRPVEISDDAALQTVYGAMEFRDGSTSGTEYYYDGNGSLVADANKGIAMIEYDNLNYPRRIQFTNGNTIEYVYSPDGQKLRAKWQTAAGNVVVPLNTTLSITASSTTQTDYVGDLIYTGTDATADNPELSKILYPDGYFMRTSGTSGVFRYFVKDRLGNNRVVNNGTAVYQRTHYYPFGGPYADVGTASDYQPYKYNGKELDRMHGLDLYDYGFRQYDPVVPMFTQQDPLAEKYYHLSPYTYCANNPVNAIDIHGDSTAVLSISSQHIALLIQNESGSWQYYSVNGNNVYSSGSFSGGRKYNDIGVGSFKSHQDFLNSEYNQKKEEDDPSTANYNYEKAYIIPTNKEQDSAIRNEFQRIASEEDYSLSPFEPNHCGTAVQKSLEAGGLKVSEKKQSLSGFSFYYVRPYLPSSAYQVIKNNNPNGYEIYKKK